MKWTTILVLKIRLEILYFQTLNMNEMQHQQNHIWFKGKNLKMKHINVVKYMFRIIDTYLLFITKLFQKA